jgi:outer membrane cobalamin receptor
MSVSKFYLNYLVSYRKWDIDSKLIYQKANQSILRIPSFTANASLSFTQKFLQNVALLQPGIEVYYNTNYMADAYMPMTRSFYLQNETTVGNYAYVDLFLNVRIKRTLFFLKFQHINAGLNGYTYMMVPGYPMPDRGLKFGLSWKFYD